MKELDLEFVKDLMGTKSSDGDISFQPQSEEEFDKLQTFLCNLITSVSGSSHFPVFMERFTRETAAGRTFF